MNVAFFMCVSVHICIAAPFPTLLPRSMQSLGCERDTVPAFSRRHHCTFSGVGMHVHEYSPNTLDWLLLTISLHIAHAGLKPGVGKEEKIDTGELSCQAWGSSGRL